MAYFGTKVESKVDLLRKIEEQKQIVNNHVQLLQKSISDKGEEIKHQLNQLYVDGEVECEQMDAMEKLKEFTLGSKNLGLTYFQENMSETQSNIDTLQSKFDTLASYKPRVRFEKEKFEAAIEEGFHLEPYLQENYKHKRDIIWEKGKKGTLRTQLNSPNSLDIDKTNKFVYITDTMNCRIQIFTENGDHFSAILLPENFYPLRVRVLPLAVCIYGKGNDKFYLAVCRRNLGCVPDNNGFEYFESVPQLVSFDVSHLSNHRSGIFTPRGFFVTHARFLGYLANMYHVVLDFPYSIAGHGLFGGPAGGLGGTTGGLGGTTGGLGGTTGALGGTTGGLGGPAGGLGGTTGGLGGTTGGLGGTTGGLGGTTGGFGCLAGGLGGTTGGLGGTTGGLGGTTGGLGGTTGGLGGTTGGLGGTTGGLGGTTGGLGGTTGALGGTTGGLGGPAGGLGGTTGGLGGTTGGLGGTTGGLGGTTGGLGGTTGGVGTAPNLFGSTSGTTNTCSRYSPFGATSGNTGGGTSLFGGTTSAPSFGATSGSGGATGLFGGGAGMGQTTSTSIFQTQPTSFSNAMKKSYIYLKSIYLEDNTQALDLQSLHSHTHSTLLYVLYRYCKFAVLAFNSEGICLRGLVEVDTSIIPYAFSIDSQASIVLLTSRQKEESNKIKLDADDVKTSELIVYNQEGDLLSSLTLHEDPDSITDVCTDSMLDIVLLFREGTEEGGMIRKY